MNAGLKISQNIFIKTDNGQGGVRTFTIKAIPDLPGKAGALRVDIPRTYLLYFGDKNIDLNVTMKFKVDEKAKTARLVQDHGVNGPLERTGFMNFVMAEVYKCLAESGIAELQFNHTTINKVASHKIQDWIAHLHNNRLNIVYMVSTGLEAGINDPWGHI